jgi:Uma2 family endonuclease
MTYRVPDRGYHRGRPTGTWIATAAVVVEIVSPDDETFDKFSFYARRGVDEVLVAHPLTRELTMWRPTSGQGYERVSVSSLLRVAAADLRASIAWPEETTR